MEKEKKMTDYELIQDAIGGNEYAFEELISRYKNLVYSIVLRMVNDKEEANDLAQEVFIKLYRNLDKYYPDYQFSTWVIRITTNHVIDYRRKKKIEQTPLENVEYDMAAPEKETPEKSMLDKEERESITKILGELPDMYKIPIVLYHMQGLSYQEISSVIDEPLSKVKNRIFRGRKMLKDMIMSQKGGDDYGLQQS